MGSRFEYFALRKKGSADKKWRGMADERTLFCILPVQFWPAMKLLQFKGFYTAPEQNNSIGRTNKMLRIIIYYVNRRLNHETLLLIQSFTVTL